MSFVSSAHILVFDPEKFLNDGRFLTLESCSTLKMELSDDGRIKGRCDHGISMLEIEQRVIAGSVLWAKTPGELGIGSKLIRNWSFWGSCLGVPLAAVLCPTFIFLQCHGCDY